MFSGAVMKTVIGCDNDYCNRWYHSECTHLELNGKTEKEIHSFAPTAKYGSRKIYGEKFSKNAC